MKFTRSLLFLLILLISACTSAPEAPGKAPVNSSQPTPTAVPTPIALSIPAPTDSAEYSALLDQAVVIDEDFEDLEYYGISVIDPWQIETFDDGNKAICNQLSDEWATFFFGQHSFENYSIQADIYLMSANDDPGIELYVRYTDEGGYRAAVNNQYAGMSWYGPYIDFGGQYFFMEPMEKHTFRVDVLGDQFRFSIDGTTITEFSDDTGSAGAGGIGAAPGTRICADNIKLWFIDANGPVPREQMGIDVDPNYTLRIYEGDCIFCFINGVDSKMPIWDEGWTYRPDDGREVIVLDQTYSLGSDEEQIFDNKIIIVRPTEEGNIEISGKLVIKNSLVFWDQTQHQETRLQIKDGGSLEITSSYAFSTNEYWFHWEFEDGSTVVMDNFVGDPWTSVNGAVNFTSKNYSTVKLTVQKETAGSSINIQNAHHVWLTLYLPDGKHEMHFPRLQTWQDWNLSGIWPDTEFTIQDSYIFEQDIALTNNTHVTAVDAVDGLNVGWTVSKTSGGFITCVLEDLGEPNNDEGVMYENKTWSLPCNDSSLTLINSKLKGAFPVMWGNVNLRVYNSNLVDPTHVGGGGTFEIYDSVIDNLTAKGGGRIYVENSVIRYDVEIEADSSVYFYSEDVSAPKYPFAVIEIDTGQFIFLDTPGAPWE